MAVNALNAFVANPPIDGGVYFNAPLGTKLPKTAIEALDPAFKDHGAVAEDGFNVSPKRETTTEKMMGGGDFIDIQTSYTEEVEITFMEDDNENVINSCLYKQRGYQGCHQSAWQAGNDLPHRTTVATNGACSKSRLRREKESLRH